MDEPLYGENKKWVSAVQYSFAAVGLFVITFTFIWCIAVGYDHWYNYFLALICVVHLVPLTWLGIWWKKSSEMDHKFRFYIITLTVVLFYTCLVCCIVAWYTRIPKCKTPTCPGSQCPYIFFRPSNNCVPPPTKLKCLDTRYATPSYFNCSIPRAAKLVVPQQAKLRRVGL